LSGPASLDMKSRFLKAFPAAKWYEYEPLLTDTDQIFGTAMRSRLYLDKADTAVLFDADILGTHPAHVRYAADWAVRRRMADNTNAGKMNRVYLAESTFSVTGSVADVRLPADPDRICAVAEAMAWRLGATGGLEMQLSSREAEFVESAVLDLKKGNGVVAAGPGAGPAVHEIAYLINSQIKASGNTVAFYAIGSQPAQSQQQAIGANRIENQPVHVRQIAALAKEIAQGNVQTLLLLGGNPAYDAPVDLGFGKLLAKVPTTIRLGLYEDETSTLCQWHIPRAHYLESWGDARAWDGTASVCQPLIEPLYGGKSIIELLAVVSGDEVTDGLAIVKRAWGELLVPKAGQGTPSPQPSPGIPGEGEEAELAFKRVLEAGLLAGTEFRPFIPVQGQSPIDNMRAKPEGFYLRFEPDARVYDGRFANNGWLQETPDPLSKLVWDNAVMIAKRDADKLGVVTGDVVRVKAGERSLEAAVYIMPGQPVGVLGLSLGYGRSAAGSVGNGLGFNGYALRTSTTPYVVAGVTVEKTSRRYVLAMTQNHHIIDTLGAEIRDERIGPKGRSGPLIREAAAKEYAKDPHFAAGAEHDVALQLFDEQHYEGPHAWGMTIDLNACIGCNACAVACQAENNIPIVGKEQVLRHREMNWIRIDRYFKGPADDPTVEVAYQPMMCHHCENAPCEQVCPVGATVHDTEGLNTMVYNRCIGTRYCSNNCPFKVRRFNYFDYHTKDPRGRANPWLEWPDSEQASRIDKIKRMAFNPEVTVRMRGVMEKCTFCVQRIHHATIGARANAMMEMGTSKDVRVTDGTILTACQQACPTQAIVFGNLRDPASQVSRIHRENPRVYVLLEDLNVRPRTRCLAKVRNPS
jgi:Fe-S-cluster-containing dehydrogenase component